MPNSCSSASTIRAVVVLPLVPVMCTEVKDCCGEPRRSSTSVMRSRSGTMRDGNRPSSAFSTRARAKADSVSTSSRLSRPEDLRAPHTMAGMTATPRVPEKPSLDGIEDKWIAVCEEQGTYRFDRSRSRAEIYSIDTPPITASGSLHVGHVFSSTPTVRVARYQRIRGREVFYRMGWDDSGLPIDRRVQNFYRFRSAPSLHYDSDYTPPEGGSGGTTRVQDHTPVSRQNFVELCDR